MIEIQPLDEVLQNLPEATVKKVFSNFKCKIDDDIERFLTKYAIEYQKSDVARTFLLMDDKTPSKIVGYYTIGVNVMHFDEKLDIGEAYKGINLYENNYRPIFKLFMIGKDDNLGKKIKMAKYFKENVLATFQIAKKKIGINLAYIDCVPELRDYYAELGFDDYDKDDANGLIRMIRKV